MCDRACDYYAVDHEPLYVRMCMYDYRCAHVTHDVIVMPHAQVVMLGIDAHEIAHACMQFMQSACPACHYSSIHAVDRTAVSRQLLLCIIALDHHARLICMM